MDPSMILALIMSVFVIAELLQVYLLKRAVNQIKEKVEQLIPEDADAGDMLANAMTAFLIKLNEDEQLQQAVGGVFAWMGDIIISRFKQGTGLPDMQSLPKKTQGQIGLMQMGGEILKSIMGQGKQKVKNKAVEEVSAWIK